MLPSRVASRAGLTPNVKPSGSSPSSSHVTTSPLPLMNGMSGSIVRFTKRSTYCVGYSSVNGRSRTGSSTSQMPSPSVSAGTLAASTGLDVPQANSSASDHVSSSSSRSSTSGGWLVDATPGTSSSGLPSPSVSLAPAGSSGKASGPATQPPLAGASGPSQVPSPSVSGLVGLVSTGRPSSSSLGMPSPSMSSSIRSQMPSPSMSSGMLASSSGSLSHVTSVVSRYPSLSSSSSAMRPPGPSGSSSG